MKKNILVTGAAGFIGKSLIRALVNCNYNVYALDICDFPEELKEFELQINWLKFNFTDCINQNNFIRDKLGNMDCAFHFATTLFPAESKDNIEKDCFDNVYCTVEFFSQLYQSGCKKIIYASSAGTVYGFNHEDKDVYFQENHEKKPVISYGLTKSVCEEYLKLLSSKYGKNSLSFRISNPYGEEQKLTGNQGVIPIFMNRISKNMEIAITSHVNSKRDYIYIDDLIQALIRGITYEGNEKVLNLCSGEGYSINEIIQKISFILKKKAILNKNVKPSDIIDSVLVSNNKIIKELNWEPKVSLDEGLMKIAKYHKII